jgi:DNA-directed RNA polymerase subunit RPC12/RpoP
MEPRKEEVDQYELEKCITCGKIFLARKGQKECNNCLVRHVLLGERKGG